jgi:5-methylcytosine-specific restriction protein A
MPREEFSRKTMRAAFARCKGHCDGCGFKLREGRFFYDHIKPTGWLGGDGSLDNCQVLCDLCHNRKTALESGDRAKGNRIKDRRIGALPTARPMQRPPGWEPQRRATRPLERPLPPRKVTNE